MRVSTGDFEEKEKGAQAFHLLAKVPPASPTQADVT
jgi:hypothetical protein